MTTTKHVGIGAALAAFVMATGAAAKMPVEDVTAAVEREYDVEVLRVVEVDLAGRTVYAVTVMNPGGDFNEAFQVNTLAIDPETGALILQDRLAPGAGTPRTIDEGSGAVIRRDSVGGR